MSLLAASLILALSAKPDARGIQKPPTKQTLYYIPHTHWEGAVFKTREEYLQMGLSNILKALDLLKKYPGYRFTLDQVAYVKPFIERYPEEAAAFRKFVKEGRLELVGGMNVMPDDVKPGGELFVRQMQYGAKWYKDTFGIDSPVAWMLDTFGHHPQMPQLLKEAGFTSFWFCRGVPKDNIPSEFLWKGIDGTTIPAIWIPGFYGLFYGPPNKQDQFNNFFQDRYNALQIHVNGPERVGLAGVDVSEPEDYVMPLLDAFNKRPDRPFDIRPSTPSDFAAVVAKRTNTPVMEGDFNPIFQGTYSSRIELKQATREIETKLLNAEKLGTMAAWFGAPANDEVLWSAWEPVLFNQTHDLASGVMTDHVYDDVKRGYDFADKIAADWSEARLNDITAHIDTRGEGTPVVVFNMLGIARSDVAEVEIGFANADAREVNVVNAAGQSIPSQIVQQDKYSDGTLKRARVAFLAKNIPALGYSVFRVLPNLSRDASATAERGNKLESDNYTITIEPTTGAITSVFDKHGGVEVFSGSANVIAREQDKGDLWELYHGLDGGSYIAMTNKQAVPTSDRALLSSNFAAKDGTHVRGPVFSEYSVSHPLGNGEFSTRIRLYNDIRRIDIQTSLVNNEKFVRYQALFPTNIKNGHYVQEIPFGAVERPVGVEYPAQNWVDWSDGKRGLAVLNAGMPGNVVNDGTLMLSLLRSHNVGGYGFGGGYEPGMSSETGFELGQKRTLHYAIVPHSGNWKNAAIYRDGLAFNQPLIVCKTTAHPGKMPTTWGMLEVSDQNVIVTSVKRGKGGTTVVRLYEASGTATPNVTVHLNASVREARNSNLLEARGTPVIVKDGEVTFNLHPFQIKTLLFKTGGDVKSLTPGRNASNLARKSQ